jgi:hypothetical protein
MEDGELIGTGFYLVANGGFATAKHVALEAIEAMSKGQHAVGIVYLLSDGLWVFRPIWRFFVHPTADLAFGIPHELYDNKSGQPYRAKVLTLSSDSPPIGARISTWAYPLHRRMRDPSGKDVLQLEPAFYGGILEQIYTERGPARRIEPPYYQTNIHLHGGASGGPVFNENGQVFGVASCSYDGAIDFAFVTPIDGVMEIELEDTASAVVKVVANASQLKCRDDVRVLLIRSREVIDLPLSRGERILDGCLNMLVPCILRRRVVDENVFVRWKCKPDMDLEPGTVTMLATRRDHSYAASDDVMIVFPQPVYLMIDYGARGLRRLGSLERHFQWDLHNGLSISKSQQL